MRQEHHHSADPGQDAIGKQVAQQAGSHIIAHLRAQPVNAALQRIGKGRRPGKHRLEHHEQSRKQDQRPEPGMQEHLIEPRMQAMFAGFREDGAAGNRLCGQPPFGHVFAGRARAGPARFGFGNRLRQLGEAFAPHRDRRDHRHAQLACQRSGIDGQPIALRQIKHIERHDRRLAKLDHFEREDQMLLKVGGIEHHHQHIGRSFAGKQAENDLAGHLFIGAGRGEAIGAGQIGQFNRFPRRQHQPPRLALDRDPGIVGDLLARAGQRVEQRAFASIGIADQRGGAESGHC